VTDTPGLREKLTAFVKQELVRESDNGFPKLNQIPDTYLQAGLAYLRSLGEPDRAECLDALAVRGARICGLIREPGPYPAHPFEQQLDTGRNALQISPRLMGVPLLRTVVAQYKMDKAKSVPSLISEELFTYAASIRSVKAPELRKAVKAAFATLLGLRKVEKLGGGEFLYLCHFEGRDIGIGIDYGGGYAQLRYGVSPIPDDLRSALGFSLERTLGVGFGNWDLITEETLGSSMDALCDCIRYAATLPSRFASWIASSDQASR